MRPTPPLRLFVVCLLAAGGCSVAEPKLAGKQCDETHPCPDDLQCVEGRCVAPCDPALLGSPCTTGSGACAAGGVWICDAGSLACDAAPAAGSSELCDGTDNDCDGEVDEALEPPPCGLGICAQTRKRCAGADGWLDCAVVELGSRYERVEATCDGEDNDCDGSVDEGLDEVPCALTQGVCAGSTRACAGGAGGGECGAAEYGTLWEAVEATCDGHDNDCDGQVDESLTGPPCEKTEGVCATATQRCGSSGWEACSEADYGATYEPTETTCDGLDNDCDGVIDETGCVWTVAGTSPAGFADGSFAEARFNVPQRLLALAEGDLLVADSANHVIRRVSADGTVRVAAGTPGVPGSANGGIGTGTLDTPAGLARGSDGTIYIADVRANRIRTLSGDMLGTAAGTGQPGATDGPAAAANFNGPVDLAWDGTRLLIADAYSCRIRALEAGTVSTVAGTSCGALVDGAAGSARFGILDGLAYDPGDGSLYISDAGNHRVRRLRAGEVSILAGSTRGFLDGAPAVAKFDHPSGLHLANGGLYVADQQNGRIRRIAISDGTVTTVAGSSSPGMADGSALVVARLGQPAGVAVWREAVHFVGLLDHRLRKLDSDSGQVVTVAGGLLAPMSDGPAGEQSLASPSGIVLEPSSQTLYFTDTLHHAVRALPESGTVATVAGRDEVGWSDGIGPAARFDSPAGVALAPDNALVVADSGNNTIRRIDLTTRRVTTLVSTECPAPASGCARTCGHNDGVASLARFCAPLGVAAAPNGTVYVADTGTQTIRAISQSGVSTVAGSPWLAGSTDSTTANPTGAKFNWPEALAVDGNDRLYVADTGNDMIRRIDLTNGLVTTLVRNHPLLSRPSGLSLAAGAEIFVVSSGNGIVVTLTDVGTPPLPVTHLAGEDGRQGWKDGALRQARFNSPSGIAVDSSRRAWVADRVNHRLRRVQLP